MINGRQGVSLESQRRKSSLPVGLLLGIGSFCCGIAAVPAAVVCVMSLRKRRQVVTSLIGLVLSVVSMFFWGLVYMSFTFSDLPAWTPNVIHRAYADYWLTGFNLPRLPASATDIRVSAGGLFAKSLYLRCKVPPRDAERFRRQLTVEPPKLIDEGQDTSKVLGEREFLRRKIRALSAGTVFNESQYFIVPSMPEWCGSWFQPSEVKHGWALKHEDSMTPEGYAICYDRDSHLLLVFWHYS